MTTPIRTRLPNRRPSTTDTITAGDQAVDATVGFDPASGRPAELFIAGSKGDLALILDDVAVIISVALQHGLPAAALAKSVARLPTAPLAPPYEPAPHERPPAASLVGAALDLLVAHEQAAR